MSAEETFGITPHFTYRKNSEETRRILGLRPTAIDQAIKDHLLPPPMPLTKERRACGWLGSQLIAVLQKRLELAEARQANPPKYPPKPKSHPPKPKSEKTKKAAKSSHASKRRSVAKRGRRRS